MGLNEERVIMRLKREYFYRKEKGKKRKRKRETFGFAHLQARLSHWNVQCVGVSKVGHARFFAIRIVIETNEQTKYLKRILTILDVDRW